MVTATGTLELPASAGASSPQVCPHTPPCPAAYQPDRLAAAVTAPHPEQGWSLLCNGVIAFEDGGAIGPIAAVTEHQRHAANVRGRAGAGATTLIFWLGRPQAIVVIHMVRCRRSRGRRAGVCTGQAALQGRFPQAASRYAPGDAQGDAGNFSSGDYAGPGGRRTRARNLRVPYA